MVSERQFTGLVESIYAAGANFHCWSDTLRQIAQAYHARTVVFGAYSKRPEDCCHIAPDIDQSVHDRYVAHYHAINPIWRRTVDLAPGEVRTDEMIVPRREFVGTEFFHDFLRPQDVGSMLGVIAHNADGRLCVVSVQRKRPFEAAEIDLHRRLAPHLQRAVQLNLSLAQLGTTCSFAVDTLDMLAQGVILVDDAGRVLFANNEAQRLFEGDEGMRLLQGVLHARSPAETSQLHGLITCCGSRGNAHGGSLAVSRGTRSKITLSIVPWQATDSPFFLASRPVAIILVDDPEQRARPTAERIMRRFGLTPKETALAMEILRGGSIQDCADRLGISRATAQTHLAHIFQKTDVRRQAELVKLLMEHSGGSSLRLPESSGRL